VAARLERRKALRVFLPALITAAADLAAKAWALGTLSPLSSRTVTPFLNLTLVENRGAAFSLLASDGPGQGLKMTALALLALIPLAWFYRLAAPGERGLLTGLGLVLGGALGNVHDRLRHGAVVDFIDLHLGGAHWPAFNLADVAVCVGVGLIALSVLLGRRPAGDRGRTKPRVAP
jgi:signal peptidase II